MQMNGSRSFELMNGGNACRDKMDLSGQQLRQSHDVQYPGTSAPSIVITDHSHSDTKVISGGTSAHTVLQQTADAISGMDCSHNAYVRPNGLQTGNTSLYMHHGGWPGLLSKYGNGREILKVRMLLQPVLNFAFLNVGVNAAG